MSRLPILSSRDFIAFLKSKGFIYNHTTGSHHILKLKDRMVSVPERKKGDIKTGLLNGMLVQAGLTREDLIKWYSS